LAVQNEDLRKEVHNIRKFNTKSDGNAFDKSTIEAVWQKGQAEPRRQSFRKDVCGAIMHRMKYGK